MANQTKTGKAFEYAILLELKEKLSRLTNVKVLETDTFKIAQKFYEDFCAVEKSKYRLSGSFTTNLLMDIEPRLIYDIGKEDFLSLSIEKDAKGEIGDVRDVIMLRALQKWEIGISAKNNHAAVKHSRLSKSINFGQRWMGIPCSQTYFGSINSIFDELDKLEQKKIFWRDIDDKEERFYRPILDAFQTELLKICQDNKEAVQKLISYLIGTYDFYKVIKRDHQVEVQAINLYGTLNQPINGHAPKMIAGKIPFPTEIRDISYKLQSNNTIIVTFDKDWALSFRIHNARSLVEPSLKFDVQMAKSPNSVFIHKMIIRESV